jgi:hypothetical protein
MVPYCKWMDSFHPNIVKEVLRGDHNCLNTTFTWTHSPEGHSYWSERSRKPLSSTDLNKLAAMARDFRLFHDGK